MVCAAEQYETVKEFLNVVISVVVVGLYFAVLLRVDSGCFINISFKNVQAINDYSFYKEIKTSQAKRSEPNNNQMKRMRRKKMVKDDEDKNIFETILKRESQTEE